MRLRCEDGEFYNAEKTSKEVVLSVKDLTLALNSDQTLDLQKTVLKVVKDGAVYPDPITFTVEGAKAEARHLFTAPGTYQISLNSTDKLATCGT